MKKISVKPGEAGDGSDPCRASSFVKGMRGYGTLVAKNDGKTALFFEGYPL